MNKAFRGMLTLLQGSAATWILVGVLMVVQSLLSTGTIVLISKGIDMLNGTLNVRRIMILAGIILLSGVLQWCFGYLQKNIAKRSVIQILKDLQNKLFQALIRKNIGYYTHNSSGAVLSRITGDSEAFGQFIQMFAAQAGVIMSIVVLILTLFIMNAYLAMWVCALIPVIIGTALLFRKLSRRVSMRMYEMFAELNANIKESLAGMTVTRNYNMEERMHRNFLEVNERAYQANLEQGKVFSSILPLSNLLSSVCICVILYIGGMEVLNVELSFGALYLFVETVQRIWDPVSSLANFSNQIQDGITAAERMLAILEDEDQESHRQEPMSGSWQGGDIRFLEVDFSYGNGTNQLKNLNLHIREGENVALIGHTGAGKTTVARILLRMHDISKGRVTIGDTELNTIPKELLRDQIGYIPQVPFLFSGTLLENLRYGMPETTETEVLQAVRSIRQGAWLDELPEGLNTQVGERGRNLSSGQRQLVVLVRMLIKNPPLLIMDEATANIDPFTERYIKEALKIIIKGRTSIIIAHRLSTVREADKIVVMHEGAKAEEGTHEQLVNKNGIYKRLYDMYDRSQLNNWDNSLLERTGKR